jgi:hypothetical protein
MLSDVQNVRRGASDAWLPDEPRALAFMRPQWMRTLGNSTLKEPSDRATTVRAYGRDVRMITNTRSPARK